MGSLNVFAKYDDYILQNASSVTSIESTLRTLTYLLPGRFQESEAASELLYATLNLLGLYHDSILSRALERLPNDAKKPPLSAHNRYTKFWSANSSIYKNLSISVTVIQHLSFLCEILARKKFGEKGKWRTIIGIEAIKAVCRIALLQETKSRPLVFPHVPGREIDPALLEESLDHAALSASLVASGSIGTTTTANQSFSSTSPSTSPTTTMTSTSAAIATNTPSSSGNLISPDNESSRKPEPETPKLTSQEAVTDYLMKKVLYVEDLRSPPSLLHTLSGVGKFAELLTILRPLIYASLLQRTGDKRNWRPWLIGIAIDYAARELHKKDFSAKIPGGLRALTKLEREEMGRRAWMMGWWALRGAFYENVTRPKIDSLVRAVERVPVLGLVGGLARDYEYWYESYFTTASI